MHVDFQFHGKLCGSLHLLLQNLFYLFDLIFQCLDEQFIMDLQDQPGTQVFCL